MVCKHTYEHCEIPQALTSAQIESYTIKYTHNTSPLFTLHSETVISALNVKYTPPPPSHAPRLYISLSWDTFSFEMNNISEVHFKHSGM